ncbi:MAG: pyridoxamine 5'-phosphate oxidase [Legionella sp.]|uniref:pyridoxamine 5'-phosphate oxidase n=1 Tax=Legionella sp. TaxID=459 RepID=UPI0039E341B1
MTNFRSIADIRRDYGELKLNDESLPSDPLTQFQLWFQDVLKNETHDPTAMVLSTVDENGYPDSRVVLLKGLEGGSFIFYTNYQSVKSVQLQKNPYAALNFYWPHMARQIRIRGTVRLVSEIQSDLYFASRPVKSQFSAIASPQSREIPNREFLEKVLNDLIQKHGKKPVVRPEFWGGYRVIPEEIEFWQGRDNRLHDRIKYFYTDGQWHHHRLAP